MNWYNPDNRKCMNPDARCMYRASSGFCILGDCIYWNEHTASGNATPEHSALHFGVNRFSRGDAVRMMTDEELAEFMEMTVLAYANSDEKAMTKAFLEWLKKPAVFTFDLR